MDKLSAILSCAVTTAVEWRRQSDGMLITTATIAPGMAMSGILSADQQIPCAYDVYARPADGSTDWQRMFEIDPVNRTVARLDL